MILSELREFRVHLGGWAGVELYAVNAAKTGDIVCSGVEYIVYRI